MRYYSIKPDLTATIGTHTEEKNNPFINVKQEQIRTILVADENPESMLEQNNEEEEFIDDDDKWMNLYNSTEDESKDLAMESFDSYSKRYVYNIKNHIDIELEQQTGSTSNNTKEEEKDSTVNDDFSKSIYELAHAHQNDEEYIDSARSTRPQQQQQQQEKKRKKKNIAKHTLQGYQRDQLRKRFSGLYKKDKSKKFEMDQLYDKELEKPPFISFSEVQALQTNFAKNFPFTMYRRKLTTRTLKSIQVALCEDRLTRFIMSYGTFCYWTFLSEYASEKSKASYSEEEEYKLELQFLKLYEDILNLLGENKQQKVHQVIQLPITLLSIRITLESIYSISYPNFWHSQFGMLLKRRLDILTTFLFDPQYYMSHIAPLEAASEARTFHKKKLVQSQRHRTSNIGKRLSNRSHLVSPLVKVILQDAKSLETRRLLTQDPTKVEFNSHIVQKLFTHDRIRCSLLA
eukprot:CAMPEP_0117424226 /NCGR_PEP_ID=MMETSP0758-20121206/4689_1 /TAXON_ID=63605 /ORGANISM="Percolomonas cosmopolitus, Strain AE-1 (ATCC 50343)" /LENGTH=459 /DNA_ID=CAMNT_0005207881 /DNA_START=354 /DNA_END=1729 /DNA_ORIENTATION=-